MSDTPFYKMKGSSALGYGNQHSSVKGMPFASPAKQQVIETTGPVAEKKKAKSYEEQVKDVDAQHRETDIINYAEESLGKSTARRKMSYPAKPPKTQKQKIHRI